MSFFSHAARIGSHAGASQRRPAGQGGREISRRLPLPTGAASRGTSGTWRGCWTRSRCSSLRSHAAICFATTVCASPWRTRTGPRSCCCTGSRATPASGRTPRGGSPRRVGWSPSTSGATAQASGGRSTCPRTRSSPTPSRSSQRSASPPPSSSGSRSAGAWPCSSPRLRGRPEPGSGAAATAPRRRGRRPLRTRRAGRPGRTAATTRPVGAQGPRPSPSGQGVASEDRLRRLVRGGTASASRGSRAARRAHRRSPPSARPRPRPGPRRGRGARRGRASRARGAADGRRAAGLARDAPPRRSRPAPRPARGLGAGARRPRGPVTAPYASSTSSGA